MEDSILKKYLSWFTLVWGVAGVVFFSLSNHPPLLAYSGAVTLIAEVFLDICGFLAAFSIYRKTRKQHYLWIGVGLVFAVIADGIYNLSFNVLGLNGEGFADLFFEIPFTVFLGCLTFASFCFIRGKIRFRDGPGFPIILLISLVGISIFILSFALAFRESLGVLERGAWLLLLITHASQTLFEIVSYVLVIVCLAASVRKEQWIFFSGFLCLLSADLGIRVGYVAQTIGQSSALEYLWVTGLFLMFLGLFLENVRNPTFQKELPEVQNLNSIQAIMALVLVAFSGLLIVFMGCVLLLRSNTEQYSDLLKDLPGILLFISLCSIQLSFYFSKRLANIFLDVYNVASSDITLEDSTLREVISPHAEKGSVKEFDDLKRILLSSRAKILQMLKKEKNISETSCQLAHEVRTPLLSIRGFSKRIEKLAEDIEGEGLTEERRRTIILTQGKITQELDFITGLMDSFLSSMKSHFFNEKTFSLFAADEMIEESIFRYPYQSESERGLIDYKFYGPSFNLWGERNLLTHVMFNLIKNALREIQIIGSGKIHITSLVDRGRNQIVVRDTAGTMTASKFERIFQNFFSCAPDGHGIGLGFCKRVVESAGGKIICTYVENEYTEFTLEFCD